MTIEFRPPVREAAPVLVGIAGPSGGGKTYSALRLARGLAGGEPFAIVDTENGRALHYTDDFPEMRHGHLHAPFSPAAYTDAIKTADAQGFPVIVVDSASHEWEGVGGVLEMQTAEFERMGGKESARMASWIAPKTAHKAFVRELLQVKAHVVLCMRAEDKVEMVKVGGKTEVRAKETLTSILGWIPICERRLPFELTISFLVTPDAPGVPKPVKLQEQHRAFFPAGEAISEESGWLLAGWAAGASTEPPTHHDQQRDRYSPQGEATEAGVTPGDASMGGGAGSEVGGGSLDAGRIEQELLAYARTVGVVDEMEAGITKARAVAEPQRLEWLRSARARAVEGAGGEDGLAALVQVAV